jgi:hypothetical protein
MNTTEQRTLFAFDCGATNWRLYRSQYEITGKKVRLVGEPCPSPLTSFIDRRLPAVILLSPDGTQLESYGENAQAQVDNETNRLRIRDYFKPCIGVHLEANPQPHQLRFTNMEALKYTRMMLDAVLAQLLREKWRTGSFDERLVFSFAYPVHWQTDHNSKVFDEFSSTVKGCFPEVVQENIRFVTEPEAAILSLQRQGHLRNLPPGQITLIFDVGGSTTDLVAGEVDPSTGELIFIGRYGEPFGGGHYDVAIGNSISDELLIPASAIANDPSALLSIRNVANRLKESLSRQLLFDPNTRHIPQRTITLVMRDGEIYRGVFKLDQDRFKAITKNLSRMFSDLIETGMETMQLEEEDIGQVVLVGGGAQLFSIFRALEERFQGISLVLADNPDESVVLGTSLEYEAEAAKKRPTMLFIPGAEQFLRKPPPPDNKKFSLESDEGDNLPLVRGDNSVGRSPENKIHVASEKISRFHAKIVITADSVTLVDLESTNGTFVNDIKLEKNQAVDLHPDDEIRFGNMSFHFRVSK